MYFISDDEIGFQDKHHLYLYQTEKIADENSCGVFSWFRCDFYGSDGFYHFTRVQASSFESIKKQNS